DQDPIFGDAVLKLLELTGADKWIKSLATKHLFSIPPKMLEPLLPQTALWAAEQFETNPKLLKELSQIMGLSMGDFIELASPNVLPVLVCREHTSLLSMLISRGKDVNQSKVAKKLILFSGDILAYLIMHGHAGSLGYFASLVQPYSPDQEISVDSILKSNALQLIYNLVVELGGDHRAKAETAIRFVAKELAQVGTTIGLGSFLFQYLLGVISRMQDVLNDSGLVQPKQSKLKIAKACSVLIPILGSDNVSKISAQLAGFLQLFIEFEFLWTTALDAWLVFVKTVNITALEELFRQICVNLIRIEAKCTAACRSKMIEVFQFIICERGPILKSKFSQLPDLPMTKEWQKCREEVKIHVGEALPFSAVLKDFVSMLESDNGALLTQALVKLKAYLLPRQLELHTLLLGEEIDWSIRRIVQLLLLTVNKYHFVDQAIALYCCD
ncbi:serine/threonine-protein kinase M1, partial [Kappamyces sp. JEL0680]